MKTPFIPKLILLFILFFLYSAGYAQQRDSVTIRGQVTDYNGQPIDSCSIFWQSPSFDDIKQAITDKNGYYTTRIPKGKYQKYGSYQYVYLPTYRKTRTSGKRPNVSNFGHGISLPIVIPLSTFAIIVWKSMDYVISTSLEACPPIRYMFDPMSLTRTLQWQKEEKSSLVHAQDLSKD